MGAALLPDPLWDLVEPFLPTPPRRPKGGRPRVSDRACLTGILFVLSGLRRGGDSARSPDSSHRALPGHAPHRAREWLGPVAVGRRAHFAWLSQFRRLRVRYDKRADIHERSSRSGAR
jgi:transposase